VGSVSWTIKAQQIAAQSPTKTMGGAFEALAPVATSLCTKKPAEQAHGTN